MSNFSERREMMVDTQVRPSDVTKFPVIEAMLTIPRENFVPDDMREVAYLGENLALRNGRVLLDPRTFAKMLDSLDIQPDEVVLDLGCGLGYSTAVLARLGAAVVAVEADDDLAAEAQANLSRENVDNAAVETGTLSEGADKHGPYDVIVIEGAVEEIPEALLEQLKDGGRIGCIFQEGTLGVCRIGHKSDRQVDWRFAFNASAPVINGFERKRAFTL